MPIGSAAVKVSSNSLALAGSGARLIMTLSDGMGFVHRGGPAARRGIGGASTTTGASTNASASTPVFGSTSKSSFDSNAILCCQQNFRPLSNRSGCGLRHRPKVLPAKIHK
jgi:hypothetical protein